MTTDSKGVAETIAENLTPTRVRELSDRLALRNMRIRQVLDQTDDLDTELAGTARGIVLVALADCILAIGACLRGEELPPTPTHVYQVAQALARALRKDEAEVM